MKRLLILAALIFIPPGALANMLDSTNTPDQPTYNPSTQRLQTQMQQQQAQQQSKLEQDQQQKTQEIQRKAQEQRDSAPQRVLRSQPGSHTTPPVQQQNIR